MWVCRCRADRAYAVSWVYCYCSSLSYFPRLNTGLIKVGHRAFRFQCLCRGRGALIILRGIGRSNDSRYRRLNEYCCLYVNDHLLYRCLCLPGLPSSFFFSERVVTNEQLSVYRRGRLQPPHTRRATFCTTNTACVAGYECWVVCQVTAVRVWGDTKVQRYRVR